MPLSCRGRRTGGGGGTGGSFSPSDIANLSLWLDASDPATLFTDTGKTTPVSSDGDLVACWDDVSDNGQDGVQATSSYRPTYKTNVLNGNSVLRFDGGDFFTTASRAFTAEFTIFAVSKYTASDTRGIISVDNSGTYRQFQLRYKNATTLEFIGFNTSNGAFTDQETIAASDFHLIHAVRRNLEVQAYVDYTSGGEVSSTGTNQADTGVTDIGRIGGGYKLIGDIAELIMFDCALSEEETNLVNDWLGSKWGLS